MQPVQNGFPPRPTSLRVQALLGLTAPLLLLGACATTPEEPIGPTPMLRVGEPEVGGVAPAQAGASGETTAITPISLLPVRSTARADADTNATDPEEATDPLDALLHGTPSLTLRARGERVNTRGISDTGTALTLRTALSYAFRPYQGIGGLVEFENVSAANGRTYNSTVNGHADRPVIADPTGTEVNQVYLERAIGGATNVRAGRQRIVLDNSRFIGNVGWRQNEQTFDGVTLRSDIGEDIDLFYGWIRNANRIFGDDHPMGDARQQTHLLNAAVQLGENSQVTGYYYLVDFDGDSGLTGQSTATLGARWQGQFDVGGEKPLGLVAELAKQRDAGKNPASVDSNYILAEVAVPAGPLTVKAGQELLQGSHDGTDRFTTPLATLHAFNGWADTFLVTPGAGLQDRYLSVGAKVEELGMQAVYHDFRAEATAAKYGWEVDLLLTGPATEASRWGAKFADYHAQSFGVNNRKVWLWWETRI